MLSPINSHTIDEFRKTVREFPVSSSESLQLIRDVENHLKGNA